VFLKKHIVFIDIKGYIFVRQTATMIFVIDRNVSHFYLKKT